MRELNGKVALITGASMGIGAATARRMAELGVKVLLAARSADQLRQIAEEIRSNGGSAAVCPCDVADFEQVEEAVEACVETFGSIDILVNNAGVIEPISRLTDSDPTAWGNAIDINIKGVYHGMRAAIPIMEKNGSGVVVNISSGAATSALEGWSHYCASKAAALMLTRTGHKEMADRGVRVVGLSPGTVATDMQVAIKASGINPVSQLDPDVHIPAEWAAEAICYLCTSQASDLDGSDLVLRDEENRKRIGLA